MNRSDSPFIKKKKKERESETTRNINREGWGSKKKNYELLSILCYSHDHKRPKLEKMKLGSQSFYFHWRLVNVHY